MRHATLREHPRHARPSRNGGGRPGQKTHEHRPRGAVRPPKRRDLRPMKLLKENLGGVVVLTLKGEFDSFVTNAFGNEIAKVQADGTHRIVLNMRLVKFVNSTALGSMIKARKACRAEGGDLVVSQASSAVKEAMESLGLDRLFTIHDDDETALAALDDSDTVELEQGAESTVMIIVPEETRPTVARLARLDADGMECRIAGKPKSQLTHGRAVSLKFRLQLYRKDYFELGARIEASAETDGQTVLTLRFLDVSATDAADIERFVADMNELRRAARESR